MSARLTLEARVEQYLAERRRIGFELRTMAYGLARFARYVADAGHQGPLTVDLMAAWARHDAAVGVHSPTVRGGHHAREIHYC